MPYHVWGDGFDFNELERAADRLAKVYRRITGNSMMWKEKYGTIRYEFILFWCTSEKEVDIFFRCLEWIVKKEPKFAGELVEDALWDFEGTREAFLKGVLHLHNALNKESQDDFIPI